MKEQFSLIFSREKAIGFRKAYDQNTLKNWPAICNGTYKWPTLFEWMKEQIPFDGQVNYMTTSGVSFNDQETMLTFKLIHSELFAEEYK